jgi:hypothetical protein
VSPGDFTFAQICCWLGQQADIFASVWALEGTGSPFVTVRSSPVPPPREPVISYWPDRSERWPAFLSGAMEILQRLGDSQADNHRGSCFQVPVRSGARQFDALWCNGERLPDKKGAEVTHPADLSGG